jgi:hypothetical protein
VQRDAGHDTAARADAARLRRHDPARGSEPQTYRIEILGAAAERRQEHEQWSAAFCVVLDLCGTALDELPLGVGRHVRRFPRGRC